MRIGALTATVLACGLAACSPPAEAPVADSSSGDGGAALATSIQPGQYRTTVTVLEMTIPGIDSTSINMQPTVTEDCVTTSDVDDFTTGNILDGDSGETCTQTNINTAGGRIQGEATCTGENGVRTVQIDGSYTSNHVEMEISSTSAMPGGAGAMTQRMRMVTDRIGECPAGETAQ